MTQARGTTNDTVMVLFDWEKAFDKVRQEALIIALERMGISRKLVNMVKAMYRNPTFKVEQEGYESEWHKQETGVRQGCPLSPYLFVIIMTVLFKDVHDGMEDDVAQNEQPKRNRVSNANFNEILYADDTICVANGRVAMQRHLAAIEKEGEKFGLKLNKEKCVAIVNLPGEEIRFSTGEKLKEVLRNTKKKT